MKSRPLGGQPESRGASSRAQIARLLHRADAQKFLEARVQMGADIPSVQSISIFCGKSKYMINHLLTPLAPRPKVEHMGTTCPSTHKRGERWPSDRLSKR
jgi:hypothetical protein